LMTVCYQEQDAPGSKRSSNLQNLPMPMYGSELLMMGRKAARNM